VRAAFVLHSAKRDGAGNAAVELLASLRQHDIEAFVVLPSAGPLEADLRPHAAAVKIIPFRWWLDRNTPWWKRFLRTGWNLLMVVPVSAAIHHWRCQLVYSNTLTVSVGALAAKLLRLPHIWHVHELWGGETGFEFDLGETFSLRLVNRFSDVCIANSKTVADRLASAVGREKLHIAYQSVTLKETAAPFETPVAKLDPDATAFLIVASVLPLKRQEDAIRAVALLKRRGVKAELWLAGEETGPYARQLRQLAASQNVAAALQRAADVILSCCPLEGFGRATVEAMLAGKPVVAARGGGNDELVRDGVNGLFYRAGDAAELAQRLEDLAANPAERARFGEEGRRWAAATFDSAAYGNDMAEILFGAAGHGDRE
jgi:glycosyltransferase involved in cell wall biosynthesis